MPFPGFSKFAFTFYLYRYATVSATQNAKQRQQQQQQQHRQQQTLAAMTAGGGGGGGRQLLPSLGGGTRGAAGGRWGSTYKPFDLSNRSTY
jgi:hypothetical protein